MAEENDGSTWTIDHCYPLSKTNLFNETDMFMSYNWNFLRPMFYNKNISKGSKFDNRLYLLQEVKANFFSKLKDQEGYNATLHW